jgi:hypothetical protein
MKSMSMVGEGEGEGEVFGSATVTVSSLVRSANCIAILGRDVLSLQRGTGHVPCAMTAPPSTALHRRQASR